MKKVQKSLLAVWDGWQEAKRGSFFLVLVQEVLFLLNCPKQERLWEKEQVWTLIKHLLPIIFPQFHLGLTLAPLQSCFLRDMAAASTGSRKYVKARWLCQKVERVLLGTGRKGSTFLLNEFLKVRRPCLTKKAILVSKAAETVHSDFYLKANLLKWKTGNKFSDQ